MSLASTSDVSELLKVLRDTPADTQAASDAVLGKIYQYLIAVLPSPDGRVHWFCTQADSTTIDAATFLIRLMAYNSVQVTEWKKRLHECLTHCALCVQGLEVAKITSQETFLAAFNKSTLDAFFAEFNKWELREVWNDLERFNQALTLPAVQPPAADIPTGTRYRLVTNWTIFQDPRVLSFLQRGILSVKPENLANFPVPPGILVLLFANDAQSRTWADNQLSMSTMIESELFTGAYTDVIEIILHTLNTSKAAQPSIPPVGHTVFAHLQFAALRDLWSAFHKLLRLIPFEWLKAPTGLPLSLRRTVLEHLRDEGPHFAEVLGCFTFLMKRLGSDLWTADRKEDVSLPVAAIIENPWFTKLLFPPNPTTKNLAWIPEYLMTVRTLEAYEIVLEKVVRFLFEDSQQPSFQEIRTIMMERSMRVLQQESERIQSNPGTSSSPVFLRILQRNLGLVISLAYDNQYNEDIWKDIGSSARKLIEINLVQGVQSFEFVSRGLSRCLGQSQSKEQIPVDPLPISSFRAELWSSFFLTTPTPNAIANIICIVAQAAHLDSMKPSVYLQLSGSDRIVQEFNHSLEVLQAGFSAWISSFAEYNTSKTATDILECDGVGKAAILLLLSPLQGLRLAGKSLIGLAFDVDDRMECFRFMLERYSVDSLNGILHFLDIFRGYAAPMPEASGLSAALVRCFADILEVLCASPDGLLHNPTFLRVRDPAGAAARMPEFWGSLTKSLALIYKRAPMWATYVDTPDMVLWMRDALILARDILKQWRVIEQASNQFEMASTKVRTAEKAQPPGRRLVEDLQVFLPELIRWLRLTDEELLHQSFTLLQSVVDLMKETHIRPSKEALGKLQKLVGDAKKPNQADRKTRLDRGRLSQLSDILTRFRDDGKGSSDDDIVVVSHSIPSKASKTSLKSTVDAPRYIQGKSTSTKPSTTRGQSTLPFNSKLLSVHRFTEDEQQKFDSVSSAPSFRRSTSTTSVAGPSRTVRDLRKPRAKIEPKNEALNQPVRSEDDSDSSESGSDEDQEPGTAAFKSTKPESPKIKPSTFQRPQVKPWNELEHTAYLQNKLTRNKPPVPSRTRRLPPDLSAFHRTVLSWDYNHAENCPPGLPIVPVHVPDQFESYEHYFRVFQPLLLLECWAQLQQSKEELRDTYQAKVVSRTHVDNWLDVDISITESVKKEWYLADTDVVLLRQPGHNKCVMGKVSNYVADRKGIQATLRCYIQSGVGDPGLQVSTLWQISKVFSLSTLNREYEALQSLRNNPDIEDFILRPSLPDVPDVNPKDLQDTMEAYKVNEPQAAAILKAMMMEGFTLIQGPPGTGKTSTICGLVTRFLSKRATPIAIAKAAPSAKSRRPMSEPIAPTARILLCAPSNAAIDELAHRIKVGYIGSQKKSQPAKIVRIGTDQAINASVKDISLDYLVEQELGSGPSKDTANEIRRIQEEIESMKQQRRVKMAELETLGDNISRKMTLEDELKILQSKREALSTRLDTMKDQQKSDFRTFDTRRRNIRNQILTQADIVCSTLSGAGHDSLASLDFDMIIIDEAAQAIELSSLIPLKYRFSRCVMVGDPKQLPPTVLSQESSRFGYNKSLFLRLQQNAQQHVHLLSIQYRMHPDISRLPSQVFYGGRLLDGPGMAEKTRRPWHVHSNFGTYKFFNVQAGLEEQSGHSIRNSAECTVAAELYDRLCREFPPVEFNFHIGVVSMYKAQIKALRQLFTERFGKNILTKIDFNTVDGFQGQEKDIIILSCVRAGPGLQSVGFLSDVRRMNVALTRAKSSLFILGHAPTLERSDDTWAQIVQDARSRSALQNVDGAYFASETNITVTPVAVKSLPAALPLVPTPSRPSTAATLPDLYTPQALKATLDAKAASVTLPQNKNSVPTSSTGTIRGTKRPGETDSIGDLTAKGAKPELPRKRQKQQTMFIPKKRP